MAHPVLDPVFEEFVRFDELPENGEWFPPLEYYSMGNYIDQLPTFIKFSAAFLAGAVALLFLWESNELTSMLLILGGAIQSGLQLVRFVKDRPLEKYFRTLTKHLAGKEFCFWVDALYISGPFLSAGMNTEGSWRDRQKMFEARKEYMKISFSRLRGFGRNGRWLALYPVDGAAFTKFYYFESFNEHILDALEKKLYLYVHQEKMSSLEIPKS